MSQATHLDVQSPDDNDSGGEEQAAPSRHLLNVDSLHSQAQIIAQLPSKQRSLERTRSTLDRSRSTSLHHRRSVKSLHPPSSGTSSGEILAIDLYDGQDEDEYIDGEDERWEMIQQIKSLTSSLDAKRKARSQLMTSPATQLKGYDKWKHQRSKNWKKVQQQWREIMSQMEVWRGAFKTIEGHFGASVLSYFRFLKWLLFLDFLIAFFIIGIIILPQELMDPSEFDQSINASATNSRYVSDAANCSAEYEDLLQRQIDSRDVGTLIIDFFQGTGWMENTILFYGYYFNKTFVFVEGAEKQHYNMPLGYLLATGAYFFVSLILMVKYTAKGVRLSLVNRGEQFYNTCTKVFCGWDFNLTKPKAAVFKHNNLFREYRNDLEEQRRQEKLKMMTGCQKFKVYTLRLIINLLVVGVWVGCGWLIVFTSNETAKLAMKEEVQLNPVLSLLVQFLPSITITGLNLLVPLFFQKIVSLEDYTPETEIRITIFRTVLLRLASIAVLVITLRSQILGCDEGEDKTCGNCNFNCWETYVGQQIFKLVLLDFIVVVSVTFLVQFPRRYFVKNYSDYRVMQFVGEEEFDIPKNVLDLVYTQTLCWLGSFYSPLIAPITVIKLFIFFYIKKLTLLKNCIPSTRPYRASRSNTFFMTVLLFSFVLCTIPVLYTITRISPSQSCGPFRIYSRESYFMFTSFSDAVNTWPSVLRDIFYFLGSWTFYVPMVVLLCLIIYYYSAVAAGNRKMINLLKSQLALEGKDKQFLLDQVRDALLRGDLKSD